jgi:hypothetical protein
LQASAQLALPSTEAGFEFRTFKPKRPAPTDPSPPVAKFIRQSSVTPEFLKEAVIQSDTQISSSGVTPKRSEVVSRLRQQINSRDAIIYDMQVINLIHSRFSSNVEYCVGFALLMSFL